MNTEKLAAAEESRITTLTADQRRVMGVLLEKAFTTPQNYPLTLRAITTAASQKSNRDPVQDYDDEDIEVTLDELEEMRLVGRIYPDGGGSAIRFRHFMRQRFDFTEAQLAIIAELWLRGRQSPGDLRARASRMEDMPNKQALLDELQGLVDAGYVRTSDALDKRSVLVDHTFYPPREFVPLTSVADDDEPVPARAAAPPAAPVKAEIPAEFTQQLQQLETGLQAVRNENSELRSQIQQLHQELRQQNDRLEALRKELGG